MYFNISLQKASEDEYYLLLLIIDQTKFVLHLKRKIQNFLKRNKKNVPRILYSRL